MWYNANMPECRRTDKTTLIHGKHTAVVILDGIFVLWAERVRKQV
jgi:uridine kinase